MVEPPAAENEALPCWITPRKTKSMVAQFTLSCAGFVVPDPPLPTASNEGAAPAEKKEAAAIAHRAGL